MCTNAALVASLENYMDDLVDCFEDFVRKSLVVISVALGTILLMVMYVLKVLAERSSIPRNSAGDSAPLRNDFQREEVAATYREVDTQNSMQKKSDTSVEDDTPATDSSKKCESKDSNCITNTDITTSTSIPIGSRPSFDEKVLREIGLSSCSKPCNTSAGNIEDSRIAVSSLPTCMTKHHLSHARPCKKFIAIRTSCCSMCCVDDDRR